MAKLIAFLAEECLWPFGTPPAGLARRVLAQHESSLQDRRGQQGSRKSPSTQHKKIEASL